MEPTACGQRLQRVGASGGDGKCHPKKVSCRCGLFGLARLAILNNTGWRPYDYNILGKSVTILLHNDIEERNFDAEPEDDRYLTGPLRIC